MKKSIRVSSYGDLIIQANSRRLTPIFYEEVYDEFDGSFFTLLCEDQLDRIYLYFGDASHEEGTLLPAKSIGDDFKFPISQKTLSIAKNSFEPMAIIQATPSDKFKDEIISCFNTLFKGDLPEMRRMDTDEIWKAIHNE